MGISRSSIALEFVFSEIKYCTITTQIPSQAYCFHLGFSFYWETELILSMPPSFLLEQSMSFEYSWIFVLFDKIESFGTLTRSSVAKLCKSPRWGESMSCVIAEFMLLHFPLIELTSLAYLMMSISVLCIPHSYAPEVYIVIILHLKFFLWNTVPLT